MNKLTFKTLLFGAVIFFTSSCAYHSGIATSTTSLSQKNFDYIAKDISGSSKSVYVFGIGGLAKNSLIAEAKANMLSSNNLLSNQAIANLTVSWKSTNLGIYASYKCTVTADIVEFR